MSAAFFQTAFDPLQRLFWKTQINILRACPPLSGLVFRYGFGSSNSRRVWIKTFLQVTIHVPGAVLSHWRNKRKSRTVLSYVTMFITTRCTLRCDKCAAHIADLPRHEDTPLQDLVHDMQSLLAGVNYIYEFMLCGGEPFLHADLDKILLACAGSDQIGSISVVTNGTAMPGEMLLGALKKASATVRISKYNRALQPQVEHLKRLFKENGIRFTHNVTSWSDMGGFGQRQTGCEKRRFRVCTQQLNWSIYKGTFHLCGKSAFLTGGGVLTDNAQDYIDLRTMDPAQFGKGVDALLKRPVLSACSHCLGNTYQTQKILSAVQRES